MYLEEDSELLARYPASKQSIKYTIPNSYREVRFLCLIL